MKFIKSTNCFHSRRLYEAYVIMKGLVEDRNIHFLNLDWHTLGLSHGNVEQQIPNFHLSKHDKFLLTHHED